MSNSKSIRLHPEHGVNPTLAVCRWCGKETGEIALLGAAYKGEAPMRMAISDDPCKTCQEGMDKGITIIEMPNDHTTDVSKRTGRWCVASREAVTRWFGDDNIESRDAVMKKGAMLICKAVADELGLFDGPDI